MVSTIPTAEGDTPVATAIPQAGPIIHIPIKGAQYVWDDVSSYVSDQAHQAWALLRGRLGGSSGPSYAYVDSAIDAGLKKSQTAWSSFVNLNFNALYGAFLNVTDTVTALTGFVLRNMSELGDQVDWVAGSLAALTATTIPNILDRLTNIETNVPKMISANNAALERWATDNIYRPLKADVTNEATTRHAADHRIVSVDIPAQITAALAPVLAATAAIPSMQNRLSDLEAENADCTQPMCDTFGPKTDLFKALKSLAGLLGLLAGFEVANLTLDDLEHYATSLAAVGASDFETFLDHFGDGTATVGDTAGTILGDVTDVGRVILHDLGVPVP